MYKCCVKEINSDETKKLLRVFNKTLVFLLELGLDALE
jgi:hypothetical protein